MKQSAPALARLLAPILVLLVALAAAPGALASGAPPDCSGELITSQEPDEQGRYTVEAGQQVQGYILCEDPEGDDVAYSTHTAPQHGSLSAPAEEPGDNYALFSYTADAGIIAGQTASPPRAATEPARPPSPTRWRWSRR